MTCHEPQMEHHHGDDHCHSDGGHDAHACHDPEVFRKKFWLTLAVTVPIVVTSEMIMDWFGYSLSNVAWVGPVLGTFVFFYGGWPFLTTAVDEIKARKPGMMLLIGMAITVAYVASICSSLGWVELEFWWELAALVTIMLLGHWQEMKAISQAQNALSALAELLPDAADRVIGDTIESVPLAALAVGDIVLVRPGARVPADGDVIDGAAEVDESMITGESRPVSKALGATVVAGTVALDSSLRVRVTAVGSDTALAGIQRLVAEAQASHGRAQALADRFAAMLFYVATSAAIITFIVWAALGDIDAAIENTVTVLIISCPHALGLAIPLVISISTALAARNGILVKDRLALERMRTVNAVLFDKTGTLTKGQHVVSDVVGLGLDESDVLAYAAAVERDSEHPLARAIVTAAAARGPIPTGSDFRALPGRGVQAKVDGQVFAVGGPALLRERNQDSPEALQEWSERGAAVLYLLRDNVIVGAFALEDEVRPEAAYAVAELRAMGVEKIVMITGDARPVAERVAASIGVDEVFAEVLPQDKDSVVAELQQRGLVVAMVGDGVNNAPALARADVGLAIGAGTDVAIESAGVVLGASDPRGVAGVIRLSRASYRKMVENLAWAAGYNLISIPLAAGAFAWAGITMPPAGGAILMSMSTIIVAANAQLLRKVQLRPEAVEAADIREEALVGAR